MLTAREWLFGAALIFLVVLLIKVRPVARGRREIGAALKAARERARAAETNRELAEALCDAATIAATKARRSTMAAGLLVRAMRAEPAWDKPIELAVRLLAKRHPRLAEKLLWRRMSHLHWGAEHRAALVAVARGLRGIYRHALRDRAKAEAMLRLSERLENGFAEERAIH